jgi:hypothetical protein
MREDNGLDARWINLQHPHIFQQNATISARIEEQSLPAVLDQG